MTESHAAGRKTDKTKAIAILEDQLAQCVGAVSDCFEQAKTIDPANDPFGTRRGDEIRSAIALLQASGKLGLAIAKIRGRFEHAISVSKEKGQGS